MLNPILSFSAIRRMRTFRTMLIVIAYEAALLILAMTMLAGFLKDELYLPLMQRGPQCYAVLLGAQFVMLVLIAPAMTSGSVAGERERQTLDLLLVTNTGSFRIVVGKILESFALLALLIVGAVPVECLCLMTGGVTLPQILTGTLFLLAVALACSAVGVFCSSLCRSTVVSGVMSYIFLLLFGIVTALPFVFGYPRRITDVVYDAALYADLTPAGARAMIPKLLCLNPGFGLLCLVQGQLHALTDYLTGHGWGRIYCTWLMMDRANCEVLAVICAGGLLLLSAALAGAASLLIRRAPRTSH
ncbi:MAG: ABC transporter permease [Clostridia bacterium]|nr:ABC transporter permease [Clostridia bacterium]